jgi:hypothetical protein
MANIGRQVRKRQYDPEASGGLGAPVSMDGAAPNDMYIREDYFLEGGHLFGEAAVVDAIRPVYKDPSDKKWYISQATSDGAALKNEIHGWTFSRVPVGELGAVITKQFTAGYAPGTAPEGKPVYLSATKGEITDVPVYDGQPACGYCVDAYNIRLFGMIFRTADAP